jgi:hypothetical protein
MRRGRGRGCPCDELVLLEQRWVAKARLLAGRDEREVAGDVHPDGDQERRRAATLGRGNASRTVVCRGAVRRGCVRGRLGRTCRVLEGLAAAFEEGTQVGRARDERSERLESPGGTRVDEIEQGPRQLRPDRCRLRGAGVGDRQTGPAAGEAPETGRRRGIRKTLFGEDLLDRPGSDRSEADARAARPDGGQELLSSFAQSTIVTPAGGSSSVLSNADWASSFIRSARSTIATRAPPSTGSRARSAMRSRTPR